VFGSGLSSGDGSAAGAGAIGGVDVMLARAQALVDTPRPEGGRPLAWHVEAMLLGDLPAIAVASARASRGPSRTPVD
jgi:hypothetical protein